ncbi:hypothetical protein ACKGJO_06865 [Gracilimonas sp. Q87]|uniref:hypothetical protein n=1 Tax=Gracilimonas sp. Q87 TaxID=3384766 RepID=UPI0039840B83
MITDAIDASLMLFNEEHDDLNDIKNLKKIESLQGQAENLFESYKSSGTYDPLLVHLIGKHLEEFGKALKDVSKAGAQEIAEQLSEETGETTLTTFGNSVTVSSRTYHSYDDPTLTKLIAKEKGIKEAVKRMKKELKEQGKTKTTESVSLSVSKT